MKNISLVMIVKDEEALLPRCLNSVKDLVEEIIVVDTGSSDMTLDIAKKFGAKTFRVEWNDDFSSARNYALSQASFEMVLHLDADEYLPQSTRKLLEELDLTKADIFKLDLIEENGEFLAHFPRLFRRSAARGYKGRIHETLDILPDSKVADLNASIIHSGYDQNEINSKNKAQRNLHLLELALEDDPTDARTNYLYARELDRRADDRAEIYYQKAIDSGPGNQDLYKFFAAFLAKGAQWSKALEVIDKGLSFYPENNELKYFEGLIYLDLQEFEKAIEAFKSSSRKNSLQKEDINSGGNSEAQTIGRNEIPMNLIWRGIGIAHKELGDVKASVKAFARALGASGEDEFAKRAIRELLGGHLSETEIEGLIKDASA